MGRRGPLPLANADRLAPHADRQLDTAAAGPQIEPPPEDPTWHPQATVWYLSLAGTPQACEYTRADWGHAHTTAAILSGALYRGDMSTAAAVLDGAAKQLMTTRPARLAARLDLDDTTTDGAEVLDLPTNDQLRRRVFGAETG